jgi:hypothetical protein
MCEKFTLAKSLMMIIACCSTYYLFLGPMKKFFLQKIVIRLQIQEFKIGAKKILTLVYL